MASASHVRYSSLSLARFDWYPATVRVSTPPPLALQHTRARPPSPSALARTRTTTWGPHLLPFSRSSFAIQKHSKSQRTTGHHPYFSRTNNSKYQQAYMKESIAVHTHMNISRACTQDMPPSICMHLHARTRWLGTVYLHAPCMQMRHCPLHAN